MTPDAARARRLASTCAESGSTTSTPHHLVTAKPNHTCPLCDGPNACAPAASGTLDTPCWCREVVVTPETLARVPEPLRGEACICARCADAPAGPAPVSRA